LRLQILRASMATRTPIGWFESKPLSELFVWMDLIAKEIDEIREYPYGKDN